MNLKLFSGILNFKLWLFAGTSVTDNRKVPWSRECIEAVLKNFGDEIHRNVNTVSGEKIRDLINKTPCMKSKTTAQVRSWIHNRRKTINKHHSGDEMSTTKRRNTIPGNIYVVFEDHIERQAIPTINECIKVYETSPSLKAYSPLDIQGFVKSALNFQ